MTFGINCTGNRTEYFFFTC